MDPSPGRVVTVLLAAILGTPLAGVRSFSWTTRGGRDTACRETVLSCCHSGWRSIRSTRKTAALDHEPSTTSQHLPGQPCGSRGSIGSYRRCHLHSKPTIVVSPSEATPQSLAAYPRSPS